MIDRSCRHARRFADGLEANGLLVANDVMLNQVLVDVGACDAADRAAEAIQADGTCWLGTTTWHGRRLLRISVSSHSTTEADVDQSIAAIVAAVARV